MFKKLALCLLFFCFSFANAASRVAELFDKSDFVENPKISETFWSDKDNELYEKSVLLWDSQDFAALERKLHDQLAEEGAAYLAEVEKRGSVGLEDKIRYDTRRDNLLAAINALPEIKVWVDSARAASGEKLPAGGAAEPTGATEGTGQDAEAGEAGQPSGVTAQEQEAEDEDRLREYIEQQRAAYQRKRQILLYAGLATIAVILAIAGWVWFRFFHAKSPTCPKCGTSDKRMVTAGSSVRKGSSPFSRRVRRKFYCSNCGFKWIQRTS